MTDLLRLSLACLRIGTFVFGGGIVMVPLLKADAVDHFHWLTEKEFWDAVALGQITPGPLLVTATFIGYKVAGLPGAAIATTCMFLPSFIMTLFASHQLARLQGNTYVRGFVQGVMGSVVGLVASAAVAIARNSWTDVPSVLIAVAALVVLMRFKLDAGLVVLSCGALGLLLWR